MKQPPPILGGQGRSPESILADAHALTWIGVVAVLLVLALIFA